MRAVSWELRVQRRLKEQCPDLQAGGDHTFAQGGQIVLVGVGDFLDQPMDAKTLDEA
jgi:hypothetical protein